MKNKIKAITEIKEENQRFRILYYYKGKEINETSFWNNFYFQVYDISNFNVTIVEDYMKLKLL